VLRYTSLLKQPARVTCGLSDSLLPGSRRLVEIDPRVEHEFRPGGHDAPFWRASAPKQLAFVGRYLISGGS
ncbi:MAG: Esterase, partial [Frankiales bacterium]|nr:Esterase [Frankiales bacterium]